MTAETAPVAGSSEDSASGLALSNRRRLQALRPVPDTEGPHVRLGLVWAVVAMAAITFSPIGLALLMAGLAAAAAAQTTWTWAAPERPKPLVALVAGVLPLAAAAGPVAFLVAAAVGAGVLILQPLAHRMVGLALGLGVGIAAASLVLARGLGFPEAVVLFGFMAMFDMANYLVGAGAHNAWEGPAAGAASVGAFSLAVAAVYSGVFDGVSPWILGAVVALCAPAGLYAANALRGSRPARTPALRRLDSLLIAGPVWVLAAALLT